MSDRAEPGADRAAGAGRAAAVVALLAVTAVVVLVGLVGALAGPDRLFDGDGPGVREVPLSSSPPTTDIDLVTTVPPEDVRAEPQKDSEAGRLIGIVVRALLAALVVGLVLLAIWTWWRGRSPRQRRRHESEVDLDPIDPVAAAAAAIVRDARAQTDLLRGGTPRNGIVQAWHRFEVQARAAGVPREEWETSTEFGLRLLDLVSADFAAVGRLAELYRMARFSDHDVTEADRSAAVEALAAIHASLVVDATHGRAR